MIAQPFRRLALACALVALLAGSAAALGVFARGDGSFETVTSPRGVTYEMATDGVYAYNAQRVVAEGVGWDIFTLAVAAPALLLAAVFVARGSFRGRLVALGLLGYMLYLYLEYSVGWAFGPLFPLFVTAFAASLLTLVALAANVAPEVTAQRFDAARFPARAFPLLTGALAALLTLMWARRIAAGLGGDFEAAGLYGETTMFVQALDLGLVVPAAMLIAWLAWRRTPAGMALAAIYTVAAIAMASAIVAMLISAAVVEGAAEVAPIAIFGAYVLAAAAIGRRVFGSIRPGAAEEGRARPPKLGAMARPAVRS